jgi:hypothetical protein
MGLDSNELDRFRITTRLPRPICQHMEQIACDRDQDVCIRITMNMGANAGYWVGMGCDSSTNFPHRDCEDMKEPTRTVQIIDADQFGGGGGSSRPIIQERRALQRVCVCASDYCNRGATTSIGTVMWMSLLIAFGLSSAYRLMTAR